MDWADFAWQAAIGLWFLGLNLLWFLGSAASRRSGVAWFLGTPALLSFTGWIVGCFFDGGGCCAGWFLVGGFVGAAGGLVLGWMLAEGHFD